TGDSVAHPPSVTEAETAPLASETAPGETVGEAAGPALLLSIARVAPFAFWAVICIGAFLARPPTAPIELEILASAWHMMRAETWVPLLNGDVISTIPPLHYWLVVLGWKTFGIAEIWPRLLSAMAALATLLLLGRCARTLWPHRLTTPLF